MSVARTLVVAVLSAAFAKGQTASVAGGIVSGVWGIPDTVFPELVSHPNATGSISFSPNDRGAYSLQVNITADVPLTNATQVSEEDGKTEFSTISILSLVGDTVAANTSICYSVWSGLSAKINSAAKGDSSQAGAGCGDMLSAQCISDLLTAGGQMNQTCHPAPFLPQSCMDQMAESFEGISLTLEYNSSDPVFFMHGAEPSSEKGNETSWSLAATNIWPVLLAFPSDDGSIAVELNCIRPDTFSEGSNDPNVNPTSTTPSSNGTSTGNTTSSPTSTHQSGATVADRVSMTMSLVLVVMLGFSLL